MSDITIPATIYCPQCGGKMKMERITDPPTMSKLVESGYATGARGDCICGVSTILAIKRLPDNPTFSLLFNIYKLKSNNRRR